MHCHAGCSQQAVIEALRDRGLWYPQQEPATNGHKPQAKPSVTTYRAYSAADGLPAGVHVRQDLPDGSKRVYWQGLSCKISELLPYRAELLERYPKAKLLIAEGEATAETLQAELDPSAWLVLGSYGTSYDPVDEALRPLLGREVTLIPDADEPGLRHMQNLACRLWRLGMDPNRIRILQGYDLGDFKRSLPELIARKAKPVSVEQLESWQSEPSKVVRSSGYIPWVTGQPDFSTPSQLASSAQAVDWLWSGYLAKGAVTLLAGREKAGKSTLLFSLMRALISGEPMLGLSTRRCKVIYVSEETASVLVPKLQRFGLAQADEELSIMTRAYPKPSFEQLCKAVQTQAQSTGAEVVIIDTLSYWLGLEGDAENSAGAVIKSLEPLLGLAAAGLAVLVTHHVAKASGEVRGSTALGALADVIVTLMRDNAVSNRRELQAVGRFEETPASLLVELEGDNYKVLGDPGSVAIRARTDSVLAALGEHPAGLTQAELVEATGLSKQRVSESLAQLERAGLVTTEGRGVAGDPKRYKLTKVELSGDQAYIPDNRTTLDNPQESDDAFEVGLSGDPRYTSGQPDSPTPSQSSEPAEQPSLLAPWLEGPSVDELIASGDIEGAKRLVTEQLKHFLKTTRQLAGGGQ